ncbi:MAG: hypothetical protein GF383_16415 [Candidatus Lokiarchaeota archaeon]|nr:hypothetical protein [Candidatus Lokiarchaeota archaeon]MBD3343345.1 hypothetical protein [Candidatus Lokiarchaeota archaeon]
MKDEVNAAKKVFKEAWDALNDFFDEKRSDTIMEKIKKAKRDEVALIKFSKGFIGNTNQINFRILVGNKKEPGDYIYEAVYLDDKKEPYLYVFKVESGRSIKKILKDFQDDGWRGYRKVKKYKSLTDFLEYAYKHGIHYNGKKEKKEEALNILIKGLKRAMEAVGEDIKEKKGVNSETAKKVAKVVAIAAVTTIVSAALTPAAGVVVTEVAGGGTITGDVIGQAGQAAVEGVKGLADPANIATKVAKKVLTKGKSIGKD